MISTEALATKFNITPSTLKKWLKGNKPSRGKYVAICQSIFDRFEYVDGEWFAKTKPNNTETIKSISEKQASETVEPTSDPVESSSDASLSGVKSEKSNSTELETSKIKLQEPGFKNQYRCFGLVKGRYIPGNENIKKGVLLTDSGVFPASLLKSDWIPPVEEKIWVTWVKTDKQEPHLFFCLREIKEEDPSELERDIFNIRGNLKFCRPKQNKFVIAIRPNKNPLRDFKPFYIDIEGTLTEPRLDSFWDVTATREGNHLVMIEGKEIFPPLKKKKVLHKNKGKRRSEILSC